MSDEDAGAEVEALGDSLDAALKGAGGGDDWLEAASGAKLCALECNAAGGAAPLLCVDLAGGLACECADAPWSSCCLRVDVTELSSAMNAAG